MLTTTMQSSESPLDPRLSRQNYLNSTGDRKQQIAYAIGLDTTSGPADKARNGYEQCHHCKTIISSVLVVAYKMNRIGQPTEEIVREGNRVVTCWSRNCTDRVRQRLHPQFGHIWFGNPGVTREIIANNLRSWVVPQVPFSNELPRGRIRN